MDVSKRRRLQHDHDSVNSCIAHRASRYHRRVIAVPKWKGRLEVECPGLWEIADDHSRYLEWSVININRLPGVRVLRYCNMSGVI
jgi:hypothetical protein